MPVIAAPKPDYLAGVDPFLRKNASDVTAPMSNRVEVGRGWIYAWRRLARSAHRRGRPNTSKLNARVTFPG